MPPKKKGKGKKDHGKSHKTEPEAPVVPIIRPNVYEIVERRLKREKNARTAAWLLYPDTTTYVKDLKLEDPVDKKKKGKGKETPTPSASPNLDTAMPGALPTFANLMGASGPMSAAPGDVKAKKQAMFNFNAFQLRELELKPEEEAWVEGEHLGDTDAEEDDRSLRQYITDNDELKKLRNLYVPIARRKRTSLLTGDAQAKGQANTTASKTGGLPAPKLSPQNGISDVTSTTLTTKRLSATSASTGLLNRIT